MTTQMETIFDPSTVDWSKFTEVFLFLREGFSEIHIGSEDELRFSHDTEGGRFLVLYAGCGEPAFFQLGEVAGIMGLRYADNDTHWGELQEIAILVRSTHAQRLANLVTTKLKAILGL